MLSPSEDRRLGHQLAGRWPVDSAIAGPRSPSPGTIWPRASTGLRQAALAAEQALRAGNNGLRCGAGARAH
ncbi:MAG: hypothetical protein IPN77_15015 [Sandaracinaceae bacterium]|nr:hypothetical protein [Sandaracinaceae bacterium]